ncbi:MAG: DNA repair exonuclease [Planctomycetia bacterium]|nr:DNA repair exonuclease [Planctomycetia bacterium]
MMGRGPDAKGESDGTSAMPIRILHTADNHVGIGYQRYEGAVRERLVAERVEALRRVVAHGNDRRAHFLVVAGDLFDRTNVARRDIDAVADTLSGFAGEQVLVLPGNHDFFEGPESRLWRAFQEAVGSRAVRVLARPEVAAFDVDGRAVRFYPCPCPSKLGTESLIGWVREAAKEPGTIHVGIAHGNVEGLGMDEQGRYFTMRQEDLRGAGVATWLLGHIHVPFPADGSGGRPAFFMPGIHTPDSVKCRHPGHAWYVEVEADGVTAFERLATGGVRFVRFEETLRGPSDVEALRARCDTLPAADTVLDLRLAGRLKAADRSSLERLVAGLRERFLSVSVEQAVAHELTADDLATAYPTGSIAYRVIADLLDDPDHPDAAWLAHELFQERRP